MPPLLTRPSFALLWAAETSINSHFYSFLPEATMILPPALGQSAGWVLKQLVQMHTEDHSESESIVVRARRRRRVLGAASRRVQLDISGFEPAAAADELEDGATGSPPAAAEVRVGEAKVSIEAVLVRGESAEGGVDETLVQEVSQRQRGGSRPSLRLLGWKRCQDEALLFIHGWTSGHKNAHHSLAQFLNLSRLPMNIKPFVFAWPCGSSSFSFLEVARFANQDKEAHAALADMIGSIAAAGIRRLHVFAHSMGNRLFCCALPEISKHLRRIATEDLSSRSVANMSVMLNAAAAAPVPVPPRPVSPPDTPGGNAADEVAIDDGAAHAARQRAKVRFETPPKSTISGGAQATEGGALIELTTCTLLHPEHDLITFVDRDYDMLRRHCQNITIYLDQGDQALGAAEILNRQPSLGKHPFALVRSMQRPNSGGFMMRLRGYDESRELDVRNSGSSSYGTTLLDLDVIDTSWMGTGPARLA